MSLARPHLIARPDHLATLIKKLQRETLVALDTESNSLYAYRERVCLIQLSTRTTDYIIDPLSVDATPLGELTANPKIELVLHAAAYDIACLKRDYGMVFGRLFDTYTAARILGRPKVGLGDLLREHFGVEQNKSLQKADWSRRPLPKEWLHYAQLDTHYLPDLRDLLLKELDERGLLHEAEEIFTELALIPPQQKRLDEENIWRLANTHRLNPRQTALLQGLYFWREQSAASRDVPIYRVLSNEEMVSLVRQKLSQPHDLDRISALRHLKAHEKAALWEAIERGRTAHPLQRPPIRPTNEQVLRRHENLKQWRKARALERGVESDIIISSEALWSLAQNPVQTLEALQEVARLGPWRLQHYGEELLRLLAQGEK